MKKSRMQVETVKMVAFSVIWVMRGLWVDVIFVIGISMTTIWTIL